MTPGVPSHGSECQTRTYPVLCWICGARIFHFRCSHGTSLLFDELGPPWPLHRDDMLPLERKLEIVVEKTGSKDAAARYIQEQMMTGTIDIAYGRRIQAAWWREPQRRADGPTSPARLPEIVRMDTYAGLEEVVTGIVRDLVAERDVYRLFGFPRTAGAAALLGELGEGRFAQITVHDTALGEPDIGSYTFLVRTRQIATFDIRRGDLFRCALRGVGVLDHEPVWLCADIDFVI